MLHKEFARSDLLCVLNIGCVLKAATAVYPSLRWYAQASVALTCGDRGGVCCASRKYSYSGLSPSKIMCMSSFAHTNWVFNCQQVRGAYLSCFCLTARDCADQKMASQCAVLCDRSVTQVGFVALPTHHLHRRPTTIMPPICATALPTAHLLPRTDMLGATRTTAACSA